MAGGADCGIAGRGSPAEQVAVILVVGKEILTEPPDAPKAGTAALKEIAPGVVQVGESVCHLGDVCSHGEGGFRIQTLFLSLVCYSQPYTTSGR